ncbi:MAG: Hpt domain-containing protein [Flexibacteraceae bacterium]
MITTTLNNRGSMNLTDLTFLRQYSGNDEPFVLEMVSMFVKRTTLEIPELLRATQAANWPAVKSAVHKLKSTINFMGITSIKDKIQLCEDLALEGKDGPYITELVGEIADTCMQAAVELEEQVLH